MIISQNTFVANSPSSVNLDILSQQIKTFWKNTLDEIVAIGNYLESLKQELVSEHGNKAERYFKEILKTEKYFPIDFAKICHKIALWYSNLSESHRKFLHRFGWGLSLSCFKELTKFNGDLLKEFFSQKERKEIKLKDLKDFLTRKTKILLNIPITSEHLEIVQKHYKLDLETTQSIKTELESLDNPKTTNLLDILKTRKFKVKGLFKKPSQSNPELEKEENSLQLEENPNVAEGKLYTEAELQNAIYQTVETAKKEFSAITTQQVQESEKKLQEISREFNKIKEDYQRLKAENERLKEILAQKETQTNQRRKTYSSNQHFPPFSNLSIKTNTRQNKAKGFGNSSAR
ncbi:MAG: hypothetical protein EA365_14075 [Gloeocapsa sp. DLM2.Bin57]|nr:MAG: hypothetical protein EA365_14075 [Gloeocapsa sp. DLM2.Bin57]